MTLSDSTEVGGSFWRAGWGDILCLFSALTYALYSTLLRKRLPDEDAGEGKASTALFFGYLGLFNALLLGPVALVVHFTGVEPLHRLTLSQVGLIVGKGQSRLHELLFFIVFQSHNANLNGYCCAESRN